MSADEARIFSEEWVEHNEWMAEANQRAEYEALGETIKDISRIAFL